MANIFFRWVGNSWMVGEDASGGWAWMGLCERRGSGATISLLALRLAVREMGLPLLPILYQNPRLVPRTVY